MTSHIGLIIDQKYQIDSKLGSGGMATVYQATRLMIGDTVAIKILHPEQVRDPQSMERFRREAQAAARLKHPNAVTIYDFGVSTDGLVYLVMEVVEGKNVRTMIRESGPLSPTVAAEIIRQTCSALEAAHKQHIVHRDMKPDNIIVDETPAGLRVKVLDFGIAWMRDIAAASLTQTGSIVGTPHYMSPEQCLGEELDSRSDIYSLGVVLFEMLAGVVPFNSPTSTAVIIQHVNQPPPPLRVINISVPPAVESVVLHALAKQRDQRPQSAQLLASELTAALGGKAAPTTSDSAAAAGVAPTEKIAMPDWSAAGQTAPTYKHKQSRNRVPLWIAGAVIPLLVGAGWFFYSSSKKPGDSTELATRPNPVVNEVGKDISPRTVAGKGGSVAANSANASRAGTDQTNAGENLRRPSYLNVSSLPSRVDFIVSASSRGAPMNSFAAELARSLRSRGKTASSAIFSPAFITSGAFTSFFNGGGGSAIRATPLSSMGSRLLLANIDVSLGATQGTSVEGLVTATVNAAFAVISAKDGSVVDSFELSSVVAGVSRDGATSAALDRIVEKLEERGY